MLAAIGDWVAATPFAASAHAYGSIFHTLAGVFVVITFISVVMGCVTLYDALRGRYSSRRYSWNDNLMRFWVATSVMAILQHTGQEIAVLADSGIERPRDLDGKTYGGFGYPNEEPTVRAVIRDDGGKGEFKTVTLNAAAYEALYGQRPFGGGTFHEYVDRVWRGELMPVASPPRLPDWPRAIVHRGLAVQREARFATMAELASLPAAGRHLLSMQRAQPPASPAPPVMGTNRTPISRSGTASSSGSAPTQSARARVRPLTRSIQTTRSRRRTCSWWIQLARRGPGRGLCLPHSPAWSAILED